jgi:hypothetical protein
MTVLLASLALAVPAAHPPDPFVSAAGAALIHHQSTRQAWNRRWDRQWNRRWVVQFLRRWHRQHPDPPPVPQTYWVWPWSCIADHEGAPPGNPSTDTGTGFYGGLQFTLSTWAAYGGSGNPADASIPAQEAVAERVLAAQGWGAWPNSSIACGL